MGLEPSRAAGTPRPGGAHELLRLAWPLILSNSLWTLQIFIDRIFLARAGSESLGAGLASAILFYTILLLFQNTANYATAFVAQYVGAGRPREVGPIVWQALYFAGLSGAALLLLIPVADFLVGLGGHEPALQTLEAIYLRFLAVSALPMLIVAAVCSFFAGRGDSRTVLLINSIGLGINAVSAWALILGHWGFRAWGIAGAGAATALGTSASAAVALFLFFGRRYREEYGTVTRWRFEAKLLRRLLRFGLPNGIFACLDALAWACFILLVGRLGPTDLAATTIGVTLNTVGILPLLGMGQAVEVLVGQRLGADEPDVAERSTWTGLALATASTAVVALAFFLLPDWLAAPFHGNADSALWEAIRSRVEVLLRFVAIFALFDAANLVLSFALRGAGDTRFVTRVALSLPWPVLVVPTWAAWYCGWGLYWAWGFASAYIMLLAVVYLVRFRQGKWRDMRVIEPAAAAAAPALIREPGS